MSNFHRTLPIKKLTTLSVFIGSVNENYMKFHGLPLHFHRLFPGSSARNKSDQLETNITVERSTR